MSNTLERFAGHRYAPGYGRPEEPTLAEGFFGMSGGFDELWMLFAAIGLMYVVLARTSRRRTRMNSKMIRDLEAAARQETFREVGTHLRLRYKAGENREY
ncbi:MAG: hypothetical protein AAGK37_05620 [Pseudomonadota bacterium]